MDATGTPPPPAWVYVLRCADGTHYVGMATCLRRRLRAQASGRGAKYLRGRLPFALVAARPCTSIGEALRLERRTKRLRAAAKARLGAAEGWLAGDALGRDPAPPP